MFQKSTGPGSVLREQNGVRNVLIVAIHQLLRCGFEWRKKERFDRTEENEKEEGKNKKKKIVAESYDRKHETAGHHRFRSKPKFIPRKSLNLP